MPDKKEFTVDVDAMLAMQVERAEKLAEIGNRLVDGRTSPSASMPDGVVAIAALGIECLKAANAIERGVLEDYHGTRNLGADNSPDLQMIAEYLAEHHMDQIEEGQTVGQATIRLLKNYKAGTRLRNGGHVQGPG